MGWYVCDVDAHKSALGVARLLGREVEVSVSMCMVKCCGGSWRERRGTQTYKGKVSRITDRYVVIQSAPLGRIQEMLAGFADLLTVDTPESGDSP